LVVATRCHYSRTWMVRIIMLWTSKLRK
jgi:hypothetical protein